MMNYPPLNELVDKAGCRYMLVTAVARRARQILDNPENLGDQKPVSVAIEELYSNEITIKPSEEQ